MKLNAENTYLYIRYNTPALSDWDPTPVIILWVENKCRRVRDRTKGKDQSYIVRVSAEAQDQPNTTIKPI